MADHWTNIETQWCKRTNDYIYKATCPHCNGLNYGHYDEYSDLISTLKEKQCEHCGKKAL